MFLTEVSLFRSTSVSLFRSTNLLWDRTEGDFMAGVDLENAHRSRVSKTRHYTVEMRHNNTTSKTKYLWKGLIGLLLYTNKHPSVPEKFTMYCQKAACKMTTTKKKKETVDVKFYNKKLGQKLCIRGPILNFLWSSQKSTRLSSILKSAVKASKNKANIQ